MTSPGPWTAEIDRTSWAGRLPPVVVDAAGHIIATVATVEGENRLYAADGSLDESAMRARDVANAKLLAAATKLLAALDDAPRPESTDALAWLHEYSRWYHGTRAKAIATA